MVANPNGAGERVLARAIRELVEYFPTLAEWKVTAGVWAFGLLVYTVVLKVALPVLEGTYRAEPDLCATRRQDESERSCGFQASVVQPRVSKRRLSA